MFLWYFGFVLLIFVILIVWDHCSKKERNRILQYMPGPKALPILGNVLLYRGQNAEGIFNYFISFYFILIKLIDLISL